MFQENNGYIQLFARGSDILASGRSTETRDPGASCRELLPAGNPPPG